MIFFYLINNNDFFKKNHAQCLMKLIFLFISVELNNICDLMKSISATEFNYFKKLRNIFTFTWCLYEAQVNASFDEQFFEIFEFYGGN